MVSVRIVLATRKRTSTAAYDALGAAAAARPRREWSPQALSNVLWAFASLGSAAGATASGLFEALQPVIVAKARDLAARDVATICWAYAARGAEPVRRVGPRPDVVFGAVARLDGLETLVRGSSLVSTGSSLSFSIAGRKTLTGGGGSVAAD